MLNKHKNWRKESKKKRKVNDKISDRMKHIMKISNTYVNIYEHNLQQVNKIVIRMLNKHENPSETSKT